MRSVVSVGFSKPFGLRFNSAFVENEQRDPPRVQKELGTGKRDGGQEAAYAEHRRGKTTTNTTTAQASSDNTAQAMRSPHAARTVRFPAPTNTARTSGSSRFPSPAISDNTSLASRFHTHHPTLFFSHPPDLIFSPLCPCWLFLFPFIHSPWL